MRHDIAWALVALAFILGVYTWLAVRRRRLEASELSRGHSDYSKLRRRGLFER